MKTPTIHQITELVKHVKAEIADDYQAFEGDEIPGIQLTVACNNDGGWSYQTGDNSYSGSAYHYPHWAVVGVYLSTNCRELAREIVEELKELVED